MPDQPDRGVVADVSKEIVAALAPDEIPLFTVNSQAYFKNPGKALESREGSDDALGFGIEAVVPLLTPVVIAVVTEVVKALSDQVAGKAGQLAGRGVSGLFKSRQTLAAPASAAAPLTPAQLTQVRSVAFARARQLNLPEDQAALLADAVIGRLAVTATG